MLSLLLCLLTAAPEPVRTHVPTIDDYFTLAVPTEIALSPDGAHLAYVQSAWDEKKEGRVNTLRLMDLTTGKVRVLLPGKPSPHGLVWAQDGKSLFFLANLEKKGSQVWQIPVGEGEAKPLTDLAGGIRAFDFSPDQQILYAIGDTDAIDPTFAELRKQFSKLEYGTSGKKHSVLWRIERDTNKAEKLTDGSVYLHEMAASPDGKRIACITAPDDTVASFEGRSEVAVLDLATKKLTPVPKAPYRQEVGSKYGWLEKMAWCPSGKTLAFGLAMDAFPCEVMLVSGFDEKLTTTRLDRTLDPGDGQGKRDVQVRGYGTPLAWRAEGELCFLADLRGRVATLVVSGLKEGKAAKCLTLTPGDVVIQAFSFAGKKVAYTLSSPTSYSDLHLQEGQGALKALPSINPQVATWRLPQLKVVHWKGYNGDRVEGILELPPDHKEGQKHPFIVCIHGGPSTCATLGQSWSINGNTYLACKGYAVLHPNYRGSTGYGDAFILGLNGKENQADVGDILTGADAMVEQGFADANRMAIMGWSNGGYLTNCAITKTTKFKAAISGAGIIDHMLEWGLADEPAYPMVFKQGKTPWQDREAYLASSPVWGLGSVKTPTLIHVGGNDVRCPPGHSHLLYRALKDYLNVPTELIVYPGEPHGLQRGSNRRAKYLWDLAWLEKWLK